MIKQILCCMRHQPENAEEVLNLILSNSRHVVGIDLAGGPEKASDYQNFIISMHMSFFLDNFKFCSLEKPSNFFDISVVD